MHDEQSAAITDAALDREIARVLGVDPSPEFAARVRQRIASEPAPAGWRAAWIVAAAGALAAVAVVVLIASRPPRAAPAPATAVPLQARSIEGVGMLPDTGGAALSGARGEAAARTRHLGRSVPAAVGQRAGTGEPEILVDPREARAIRAFFEGVRDGRIDLTPLLAVVPSHAEPEPAGDIHIAPIVLDPIGARSGAEGVLR